MQDHSSRKNTMPGFQIKLPDVKNPAHVKVSLTLTEIKPLHTQWIVLAVGISEAVESVQYVIQRIANPFAC